MAGHPSKLRQRVERAAEAALAEQQYVAPVDVLAGVGWIHPVNVRAWRSGRIPDLEDLLPVDLETIGAAVGFLEQWARARGLGRSETSYLAPSRDRRLLRFTAAGDEALERALRTHWVAADLPESERNRMVQRQNKAPDLVPCPRCASSPAPNAWA